MSLDRPQRVPITDQAWLRYFAELEARTGDTDNDLIAQTRTLLSATDAQVATLSAAFAALRAMVARVQYRLRAVEQAPVATDALARTAMRRLNDARFLGDFGWH